MGFVALGMMLCAGLMPQTWHLPSAAEVGIAIAVALCQAGQTYMNYVDAATAAGAVPGLGQMEIEAVERAHAACCTTLHLAVVWVKWLTALQGNAVAGIGWWGIDMECWTSASRGLV